MQRKGIVEGFYWKREHSVNSRYGEFDSDERIKLLNFMSSKGLNSYLYDPKVLRGKKYERAYSKELIGDDFVWRDTFDVARENRVDFIWGLAPGKSEYWKNNSPAYVLEHLFNLGLENVGLLFDDVCGGARVREMKRQAKLAEKLNTLFPNKINLFCPGKYKGSKEELETYLQPLDECVPENISLMFTGNKTWNRQILSKDVPKFNKRGVALWDNWTASDNSAPERVVLKPVSGRSDEMLGKLDGYFLNTGFPVGRTIPSISSISEMLCGGINLYETPDKKKEIIEIMANDWNKYLGVDTNLLEKVLSRKMFGRKECLKTPENALELRDFPSIESLL